MNLQRIPTLQRIPARSRRALRPGLVMVLSGWLVTGAASQARAQSWTGLEPDRIEAIRGMAGLQERLSAALEALCEPPDDGSAALLPCQVAIDGADWADGVLELRLTAAFEDRQLPMSPTGVERMAALLAWAASPDGDVGGVRILCRRSPEEPWRSLEWFLPVSPPGVYMEPDDPPPPDSGPMPPPKAPADQVILSPGRQPAGALSGVIVYASAGHGWTAGTSGWYLQRGLLHSLNEDYGNIDQLDTFVEYCFNAGATVVPYRPVGYQSAEVVLDQDDPEVTYTGVWTSSTGSPYYENGRTVSGVSYRYAVTSASETATARYTPNLPNAGFYPVYTWVLNSSNRTTQKYRIVHSGGAAEVIIDHRMVGKGWVWLGNHHFNAGTSGYVEISNQSPVSGNVIADAIRFGNGIGDVIGRNGTVSGYPREEEASRYWAESEADINAAGLPSSIYDCCTSDGDDNVGTAARWAREMNNEAVGNRWNRVYLEFHTNAHTGTARGTVALITTTGETTHQALLADIVGEEIEEDMQLLENVVPFEHPWASRANTYTSAYGAISTANNGNEFDATILEVAFHDNVQDAQLLLDAKVRDAVSRSSVHALIKFLHNISGGAVPLAFPPDRPRRLQAVHDGAGGVTVTWQAPPSGEAWGGPATSYRVYRSANGYGFDAGVDVGAATSVTLADIPPETTVYLRVAGGESMPSETLAVRRPASGQARVLIVSGFDVVSRFQNPVQTIPLGAMQRPIARQVNSFDYTVQHAAALAAAGWSFDACANEAIIDGTVSLSGYRGVVWILGEQGQASTPTLGAAEQAALTAYLNAGGSLFISGAELAWDLDWLDHGRAFFQNVLGGSFIGDDAGTYGAVGSGGCLQGLGSFSFSVPSGAPYDADWPDRIGPRAGAETILTYLGGTADSAGIAFDPGTYRAVSFGVPFETISPEARRIDVMSLVMDYLTAPRGVPGDFDGDQDVDQADFAHLQRCLTGATLPPTDPACFNARLDRDGDVDLDDVTVFLRCMTGPNQSGNPACAD